MTLSPPHIPPPCPCADLPCPVPPGPPWSHRPDRTPGGAGGEGRPGSARPPGLHGAERRNCECGETGGGQEEGFRVGFWFGGVSGTGVLWEVGWWRWERGSPRCPHASVRSPPIPQGIPGATGPIGPAGPPGLPVSAPPPAASPASLLPLPPLSSLPSLLSPFPPPALTDLVLLCRARQVPRVPREPW